MFSRRDFLQVGMATSAIYGASGFGSFSKLAAQQKLSQDDLLQFDTYGNVSLIHITDIHAQLKPIYFREPEINLGVGSALGQVPHITGANFRKMYGIDDGSPSHYALTHNDFSALANEYGRVGGLDRVATVVKSIRADRPDAILSGRRGYLARFIYVSPYPRPGHGECYERAQYRGDDISLGIYPRF